MSRFHQEPTAMKIKTGIFENINYITGFINNNRNIEERSLNEICDYLISLSYNSNGQSSFLDIGCGTGRFSIPIAQRDQRINITCLDSSRNMLDQLENRMRDFGIKNIKVIHKDFENYQTSAKYNIAFMSALIHLLEDKRAAFHQVGLLQNTGDYFVLRTPFRDQIEHVDVYKWMPEAIEIYRSSHPTREEIHNIAKDSNYMIKSITIFKDTKYLTREKFLDIYYKKEHSAFWEIPNQKFQEQLREIERKTKEKRIIKCSSNTSLITMQKTSK